MTMFMKLIKKNERNEDDIKIDKDLNDIRAYMRDLIQSSFDFLRETIHLTIIIDFKIVHL